MRKITFLFILFSMCALLAACAVPYKGDVRPHFDGKVFLNPGQVKDSSVLGYLWLRLTRSQAVWPEKVPLPANISLPPARVSQQEGGARVTLIGHATMLIQVGGSTFSPIQYGLIGLRHLVL